jgi:hypothetical protein
MGQEQALTKLIWCDLQKKKLSNNSSYHYTKASAMVAARLRGWIERGLMGINCRFLVFELGDLAPMSMLANRALLMKASRDTSWRACSKGGSASNVRQDRQAACG